MCVCVCISCVSLALAASAHELFIKAEQTSCCRCPFAVVPFVVVVVLFRFFFGKLSVCVCVFFLPRLVFSFAAAAASCCSSTSDASSYFPVRPLAPPPPPCQRSLNSARPSSSALKLRKLQASVAVAVVVAVAAFAFLRSMCAFFSAAISTSLSLSGALVSVCPLSLSRTLSSDCP